MELSGVTERAVFVVHVTRVLQEFCVTMVCRTAVPSGVIPIARGLSRLVQHHREVLPKKFGKER